MTDGPFRNLKLDKRWKRFFEAAQNDTVDRTEIRALASDALIHEILTEDTKALLADLHSYEQQKQLDLDPASSCDSIFDEHSKTPFSDFLQKELKYRLIEQVPPNIAINHALETSADHQILKARNHIEEECIRTHESGEMWQNQFNRTLMQVGDAFDTLNRGNIYDAIRAGNKNAFKNGASKKKGLDEGPNL